MKLRFHGVRTRWIRGFMTFELARHTRTARLMVPVCPESDFVDVTEHLLWPENRSARP
jgi:hypothetical protein